MSAVSSESVGLHDLLVQGDAEERVDSWEKRELRTGSEDCVDEVPIKNQWVVSHIFVHIMV